MTDRDKIEETKMYFALYSDSAIYGTGTTMDEAIEEAQGSQDPEIDSDDFIEPHEVRNGARGYALVEMTKELFDLVEEEGGNIAFEYDEKRRILDVCED